MTTTYDSPRRWVVNRWRALCRSRHGWCVVIIGMESGNVSPPIFTFRRAQDARRFADRMNRHGPSATAGLTRWEHRPTP